MALFGQQRAARRIRSAVRYSSSGLFIYGLGLDEIPAGVRELTKIKTLHLGDNSLTELPEWLCEFTQLEVLNLWKNRLTEIPEWIGRLDRLTKLDVSSNPLVRIPDSIGQLTSLTELSFQFTKVDKLPESVGRLANLAKLDARYSNLVSLPESVGRLENLTTLRVTRAGIISVPAAVTNEGAQAVVSFFRARQTESERQWRSKLLVVGEGAAGKTTLLKVLTGTAPDPREQTTHGLNIKDLPLPHPSEPDVTMRLSAWDFGGQHVYHATHQFFLTDQSLFLLVWNARTGWDQARGNYWLDMIGARTGGENHPAAPVILVATHSRDRAPDLPLTELRRAYPNIVAAVEVDSLAGDGADGTHGADGTAGGGAGFDRLREAVAKAAAKLPLMGSSWPTTWLAAQQAVRESPDNRMGIDAFHALLESAGIEDAAGRHAVTGTLHQLGEILHYAEDPQLSGTVVLNPAWLSERVAAILDCRPVAERHGLLLADDVAREWSDVGKELQRQLLFMMDRYDVSYRVADAAGAPGADGPGGAEAIVVDRLPWEPPDYHDDWEAALDGPGHQELRLHYTVAGTVPPGIPGWFIAHAHRFADPRHRPWRTGVLLAHPDQRHLGLLRFDQHTRTVELAVRGPRPAGFLGLLDLDFAHAVLRRYPGLPVTRTVPCPCRAECPTRWPFDNLVRLQTKGQTAVQCVESGELADIGTLIDGIAPARTSADDPEQIAATMARIEAAVLRTGAMVREQGKLRREDAELRHLDFARLMGWMQVATPTVFTVTEKPQRMPGAHRYMLRLYCAEPNAVHQLPDDEGCYPIAAIDPWVGALARHLATVAGLLSGVTGLTGTILGRTAADLHARSNDDLQHLRGFLDHVRKKGTSFDDRLTPDDVPDDFVSTDSDARKIEELLRAVDPRREWGGLSKTMTPGGLTLFLCRDHALAYSSPGRRPVGL